MLNKETAYLKSLNQLKETQKVTDMKDTLEKENFEKSDKIRSIIKDSLRT
jgi:hypothetical protein